MRFLRRSLWAKSGHSAIHHIGLRYGEIRN
jgi:hypothetical protein